MYVRVALGECCGSSVGSGAVPPWSVVIGWMDGRFAPLNGEDWW